MEQVYQDTICVQPIIIASRRIPKLIDLQEPEDENQKTEQNSQS